MTDLYKTAENRERRIAWQIVGWMLMIAVILIAGRALLDEVRRENRDRSAWRARYQTCVIAGANRFIPERSDYCEAYANAGAKRS